MNTIYISKTLFFDPNRPENPIAGITEYPDTCWCWAQQGAGGFVNVNLPTLREALHEVRNLLNSI